uniref:Uncharacterized protein n=1 Tax=Glossina pallidipes TaxID=7398 RepID=A0A1A9ZHS9_GLOPL
MSLKIYGKVILASLGLVEDSTIYHCCDTCDQVQPPGSASSILFAYSILTHATRSSNWNCKRSNKVYNEKFISGMPVNDNKQLMRTRSSAMEFMRSFVSEEFKKSSQALSITSNAVGGFAAKIFGVVLNTFEPREAEFWAYDE